MSRAYTAAAHGGGFRSGQPRMIVIHDLEAPVRNGMVWDLATGWLQTAGVSPHRMTGPDETVETLPINLVGYHVRSPGNEQSVGLEHCGYASNTLDQWTSGAQWQVLYNGARELAKVAAALDIPLRWLSGAQVKDGVSRGVCTHADISVFLGGTDHTDPGPNFPFDAFMRTAQQFAGDYSTGGGDNPNPTPDTGKGGADPVSFIGRLLHRAS